MRAQASWSLFVGGGGWREWHGRTAAMRRIGHRGRAVAVREGAKLLGMRRRWAWRGRIRCWARVGAVAIVVAAVVVDDDVVVIGGVVGACVWQSRVSRIHNGVPDFQVVRSAV